MEGLSNWCVHVGIRTIKRALEAIEGILSMLSMVAPKKVEKARRSRVGAGWRKENRSHDGKGLTFLLVKTL